MIFQVLNRAPDLRDRRGQPDQRGSRDPERRRVPRDLLSAGQLRLLVLLRGRLIPLRLSVHTLEQLFRLGHMHGKESYVQGEHGSLTVCFVDSDCLCLPDSALIIGRDIIVFYQIYS